MLSHAQRNSGYAQGSTALQLPGCAIHDELECSVGVGIDGEKLIEGAGGRNTLKWYIAVLDGNADRKQHRSACSFSI